MLRSDKMLVMIVKAPTLIACVQTEAPDQRMERVSAFDEHLKLRVRGCLQLDSRRAAASQWPLQVAQAWQGLQPR